MRRARKAINQINVVPYIDVMLVLLVIFMITAPLVNPGQIELPSVGVSSAPPLAPLQITIEKDGSIQFLDKSGNAKQRTILIDDLIALVKTKQAKAPPGTEQAVVISADKAVRYESVIGILDKLHVAGVKKVGLLVEPK
ncbi:MAG TPA: biopolymer transporter ExbD [Casimicrobiaceae bacterium]